MPQEKQWTQEELQKIAAERAAAEEKKKKEGTVSKVLPGSTPQYGTSHDILAEQARVKATEAARTAASTPEDTSPIAVAARKAAEAKKQREALKEKQ